MDAHSQPSPEKPGNIAFISFFLFYSIFWLSATFENCPLLGPVFPPPSNISSGLQDAFSSLTQALGQAITSGNSSHGLVNNQTFYSVQFFSVNERRPLFEYYYTTLPPMGSKKWTAIPCIELRASLNYLRHGLYHAPSVKGLTTSVYSGIWWWTV